MVAEGIDSLNLDIEAVDLPGIRYPGWKMGFQGGISLDWTLIVGPASPFR